jgi:glucose/arabinose dehydrogenase
VALALLALPTPVAHALPPGFIDETFASGLSGATALAFSPDGRLVVTLEGGTARIISNGVLRPTPFANVVVDGENERGLLGVTFHPNFASNQHVYFYYTVPAGPGSAHNRITRFTVVGDAVIPGSAVTILDLDPLLSATHHMGGAMAFGRDGKLYVTVGDASSGANAQSLATRHGKLLRLNPDGSIPGDNPTAFPLILGTTTGANRAIWAVGLRNPFTFAFQPHDGALLINDVGRDLFEEINRGARGRNYGWPFSEGPTSIGGVTPPLYAYVHRSGSPQGCAITGGTFYNPVNATFPASFVGKYFFTDLCGNWIYYIDPARPEVATAFQSDLKLPVGLTAGSDGALYYAQRGGGQVRRIRYTGGSAQRILVSTAQVDLAEGGTVRVAVRLATVPATPVTLTVDRSLSDYLIAASPKTMTFTAANWDLPQSLMLTSTPDADATDEAGRFSLWSPGLTTVRIRATVVDGDRSATAPQAVISIPRSGDTVAGTQAEFFGDGRSTGSLARAEFYVDNVLRYTDPTNPSGHFHIGGDHNRWNTTLLANGNHTLRMRVFDSRGEYGTHEIRVRVAN